MPSKILSSSEHGASLQATDTPRVHKAQMAPGVAESFAPDYGAFNPWGWEDAGSCQRVRSPQILAHPESSGKTLSAFRMSSGLFSEEQRNRTGE